MAENGYGSESFQRASNVASACREIDGRGPSASLGRLRAGSRSLTRYERGLPIVDAHLSATPEGLMIEQHFAIREDGRYRYRGTQGVLRVPDTLAAYLRGRSRQAVRTNVGHARRTGWMIMCEPIADWKPGRGDSREGLIAPGPVERWVVLDSDGGGPPYAEAILSVDTEVALLHGLTSTARYARWFLHTAIVDRLCGNCKWLLVNGDGAYTTAPGVQHFQRLLGYEVARLRLDRTPVSSRRLARLRGKDLGAMVPQPLDRLA
jgi:hypothetical protein